MTNRTDEISRLASVDEVARYKARESRDALFSHLPIVIPLSSTREAHIVSAEMSSDDNALQMVVRVFDGRRDVSPNNLNPWFVINPPMLMEDASGDITIRGQQFREDPVAVIVDLVKWQLS
jgi:hypothetical protein